MKFLITFIISVISWAGQAQTDKYAQQAIAFSKYVVLDEEMDGFYLFLSDSIINNETLQKVKLIRQNLKSETLEFYMVRAQRKVPLFNINIYDATTLKPFGDIRVLFSNEDDLLIDGWEYFKPKVLKESFEYPDALPPPPPTGK